MYDYFAATRFARDSENPYLRPGDHIRFEREDRRVSLGGEVHWPGAYQLRSGDDLGDLINLYGDGATDEGDLSRVEIRRIPREGESIPVLITVDAGSLAGRRTGLEHLDQVRVPGRAELQPVVYFEGAVNEEPVVSRAADEESTSEGETAKTARVFRHPLREGETLFQALRSVRARVLSSADLRSAELRRVGEDSPRPLDLEALLYEYSTEQDLVLRPGDRILIPFGEFEVYVSGEVKRSQWVSLSTLTRLEMIRAHFTPYSSERNVVVESRDGSRATYDLHRADRAGDARQNPFLRPGDRVVVRKYDRQVRIAGQVKRPGTYQLLPGEELSDLIYDYADGPTVDADLEDIRITRSASEGEDLSTLRYVDAGANPAFGLLDQDAVSVPNRNDYLPVVFFEGAVGGGEEELGEESTSDQLRYQFRPGETLSYAVRQIAGRFTPASDLENAYLLRQGLSGIIGVDLRDFLYSRNLQSDIELQPLDRIIVPFRQFFVTVSGAVALPGQYSYIPDRTYEYYLGLAGGTDPNRNIGGRVRVRDVEGERRRTSAYIQPEDNIFVPTNNPLAYLGPFATVLGTTVSLVSLVLTLTGD